jgi:hypothetical protein
MSDTVSGALIFPSDEEILEFFNSQIVKKKSFNFGMFSTTFVSEAGVRSRLVILTDGGSIIEDAILLAFEDKASSETVLDVVYKERSQHGT